MKTMQINRVDLEDEIKGGHLSIGYFKIVLINFFIAACMGLLMRYAFVAGLEIIEYRNLMHGHSHVAMLGWLYMSLFIFFVHYFIKDGFQKKEYVYLFILTEISVLGMAISFPIQGYALFSISFSTIHVLLSYYFIYRFIKATKETSQKHKSSLLLAKTAFLLMVLSTIALFALGPIMALDVRSSNFYFLSIQFFLHFQLNGWFIFALLAILCRIIENYNIKIPQKLFKRFYVTLVVSCFLTYAMAVTWSNPSNLLFLLNSVGVLVQLISLFFLFKILKHIYPQIAPKFSKGVGLLMMLSIISLSIKIVVQFAVVIPFIAKIAYTIRNYVIGFIHLILLAILTFGILAIANHSGFINLKNKTTKTGVFLLVLGILLSEIVLFVQGTLLWAHLGFLENYYEIIFAISAIMPAGILVLIISLFNKKKLNADAVTALSQP